jgi:hypothetical protein
MRPRAEEPMPMPACLLNIKSMMPFTKFYSSNEQFRSEFFHIDVTPGQGQDGEKDK